MAENTNIAWTDHTCNFFWGCFKVSLGCANCYAESFSKRLGKDIWGPPETTERWRTKGPWKDILKWNRKAREKGVSTKVFVSSMADFFEDHPQVNEWRPEAVEILENLTNLDVQLLTKRPENVHRMVPLYWLSGEWPEHIWLGTSAGNQEWFEKRVKLLKQIPAPVRFLSLEPLIGPIDLGYHLTSSAIQKAEKFGRGLDYTYRDAQANIVAVGLNDLAYRSGPDIHWIIVGGESGTNARPMELRWACSIINRCAWAGTPIFFKQTGAVLARQMGLKHPKGEDPEEWPDMLKIQQFPQPKYVGAQYKGATIWTE